MQREVKKNSRYAMQLQMDVRTMETHFSDLKNYFRICDYGIKRVTSINRRAKNSLAGQNTRLTGTYGRK